jgi:hypothetical protein
VVKQSSLLLDIVSQVMDCVLLSSNAPVHPRVLQLLLLLMMMMMMFTFSSADVNFM